MPTIQQLPFAVSVDPADEVPISQGGSTHAISVGTLLSGMQPAISAPAGTLLGRISIGPGGPEPVEAGIGVALDAGSLVATGGDHATYPIAVSPSGTDQIVLASGGAPRLLPLTTLRGWLGAGSSGGTLSLTSLPVTTALGSADLIAVSQNGTTAAISYANLLNGETIDQTAPALAAGDTDAVWVSQGSSTLLRQTFAAIWNWIAAKLPTYKMPVVELSTSVTLDGTIHNGRVLVCSQPVTLTPAFLNMGSGFCCDILNQSAGNVVFGAGITTSTGQSVLPSGQMASLRGVSYSAGNVVFAAISSGASAAAAAVPSVPGPPINVAAGAVTASSVDLTWSPPASGGAPSTYLVQFAPQGGSNWSTFAAAVTGLGIVVTGLAAATAYQFQITASNSSGAGPPSATTIATTATPSGSVTSIGWNLFPAAHYSVGAGAIGVNVHVAPSTASVQFGVSNSGTTPPASWVAGTYVNSDLWGTYVPTPATAGTYYVWCEGTDGSAPTVCATSFAVS